MKKIITSLALAAALMAPMAVSADVAEFELSASQLTYIQSGANADDVMYTPGEPALANYCTINDDGTIRARVDGASAALAKIKLTDLEGYNVTKATLQYYAKRTSEEKTSQIYVAKVNTSNWTNTTATWKSTNTTELGAVQLGATDWVGYDGATVNYDVTETVKAAGNWVGFAFYTGTGREQAISNVKLIVEAIDASSSAEITLNYVCGDKELKQETKVVNVGECYVMEYADMAPIYVDGVKYIYKSDNAADKPGVAGTATTVTVTYVEATKYVYSVNYLAGEEVIGTKTDLADWEKEYVYQPYPQYINVKGTLYAKDAINKEFRYPFTLETSNMVVNIDGYKQTSTSGVIYYTEAEDLPGVTVINDGNALVRSSNAASAKINEDTKVITLPAGSYKLYMVLYNSTKTDMTAVVMAGETEIASWTANNSNYDAHSKEFELEAPADIILQPVGNGKAGIDLLYIVDQNATSGISAVAAPAQDGKIYNLQGVEVKNPQKGIYIMNGKKVYVK